MNITFVSDDGMEPVALLPPTNIASVDGLPTEFRNESEDLPVLCLNVPFLLPGPVLAVTCELCYVSQCCCCCCSFFFDKVDIKNSCCAKVSSLLQEENQFLF